MFLLQHKIASNKKSGAYTGEVSAEMIKSIGLSM